MVPVEDKSPPHNLKLDLNLHQSDNVNRSDSAAAAPTTTSPTARILNFERQPYTQTIIKSAVKSEPKRQTPRPKTLVSRISEMDASASGGGGGGGASDADAGTLDGANSVGSILANSSAASSDDGKKFKITKIGTTKSAALKR